MKFVMLVLCSLALKQTPVLQRPRNGEIIHIGPVNREIADRSPVATAILTHGAPHRITNHKIAVNITIHNLTDHELSFTDPLEVFDVHNSKTGERAPETPIGCDLNFFSPCHTTGGFPRLGGVQVIHVPPHGTEEDESYLDIPYQLDPGEYTVLGYVCAAQREGPECFKTNTIKVTVK